VIIEAAKRIFNSEICRSYCDFYFGITFSEHTVFFYLPDIMEAWGDQYIRTYITHQKWDCCFEFYRS